MPPAETSAPTTTGRGYSPAEISNRLRIGLAKVHAFIRKGELVAVNVATNLCGRPMWRITPESLAAFETKRTSAPIPKPVRRRRKPEEHDYYPD